MKTVSNAKLVPFQGNFNLRWKVFGTTPGTNDRHELGCFKFTIKIM